MEHSVMSYYDYIKDFKGTIVRKIPFVTYGDKDRVTSTISLL